MKFTNNTNLPKALIKAMQNDPYDKGDSDFTATGLIKPSRIVALEKKHHHEIEQDAEDGLYRLYGQLVHGLLERANETDLAEKRFFTEISGAKVSAQLDTLAIEDGILTDYKFTTAWSFKADKPAKPEWIAQLNIQLELIRRNGLDAKALRIVGLLRDWSPADAKRDANYPQAPVAILTIPMWSREQTVAYVEMRIASHREAEKKLPECSSEERWAKQDSWAVIKIGNKSAMRGGVHFSLEGAKEFQSKNHGTFIEHRPGESVRCANYCSVSKFCSQYQKSLKQESESACNSEKIS